MLWKKYGKIRPVELLMSVPGIGFLSALTLYAEICDIKRFSTAEKLAHYTGLVPKVRQTPNLVAPWLFMETAICTCTQAAPTMSAHHPSATTCPPQALQEHSTASLLLHQTLWVML